MQQFHTLICFRPPQATSSYCTQRTEELSALIRDAPWCPAQTGGKPTPCAGQAPARQSFPLVPADGKDFPPFPAHLGYFSVKAANVRLGEETEEPESCMEGEW